MTLDYVLYEMSYTNLIMYSSILPSYNPDSNKKKQGAKTTGIAPKKGSAGGLKGLFNTLRGQ